MTDQKLSDGQRQKIVNYALKFNGWGDGSGYPGKSPNPACTYVGHGLEYSCADGVTMEFGKTGHPLVSMQPGMAEGYAYCPDALLYGRAHDAVIPSWKAQPADVLLIDTGDGAQPGHTELVTSHEGDWVFSIGWDSGPSNVDHFTGQGGVHRHKWYCPAGVGNSAILAVLDADKIVDHSKVDGKTRSGKKLKPPARKKNEQGRELDPPTGQLVQRVDKRLDSRTHPVTAGRDSRGLLKRLRAAIDHALAK